PGASLVGHRAGLEEHPQQFAADPPALCLWVLALALDAALRPPLPPHWLGTTHQHHEPLPCSAPDLTEEGLPSFVKQGCKKPWKCVCMQYVLFPEGLRGLRMLTQTLSDVASLAIRSSVYLNLLLDLTKEGRA